jgi:GntP family gluconate:H+ symporter
MLIGTVSELIFPKGDPVRGAATFIGHPTVALALPSSSRCGPLANVCGHKPPRLLKFTEDSIATVGMTLLVVGGGGGFARVLREAGVATSLGDLGQTLNLPPLVYAWAVAAFIRVATGSATVSITATSELLVRCWRRHRASIPSCW